MRIYGSSTVDHGQIRGTEIYFCIVILHGKNTFTLFLFHPLFFFLVGMVNFVKIFFTETCCGLALLVAFGYGIVSTLIGLAVYYSCGRVCGIGVPLVLAFFGPVILVVFAVVLYTIASFIIACTQESIRDCKNAIERERRRQQPPNRGEIPYVQLAREPPVQQEDSIP